MGVERIVKFTCDRCGEVVEKDSNVAPPGDWWRFMLTRPMLASPMEVDSGPANRRDRHLCGNCVRGLNFWWDNPPSNDDAGADA